MISDYIKKLTAGDPWKRARLAEEIGDFVEYGEIAPADAEKLAAALIQQTCQEKDPEVTEALLNTLVILGSSHLGLKAPWEQLVPLLGKMDKQCLEHALFALGTSHDAQFAKVLQEYLSAPDESIREEATRALRELSPTHG